MAYNKKHMKDYDKIKDSFNDQEDRIEKAVNGLENKTTPSGWNGWNDFVSYQKMGDIVMLRGGSVGRWELKADTYVTIATLSSALSPTAPLTFPLQTTSTTQYDGIVRIKVDGTVQAFVKGKSTSYWEFTAMYFVK